MVALIKLSRLDSDTQSLLTALRRRQRDRYRKLQPLALYRDAEQTLRQMGMAVPPELRMFETVINVPGMAVREPAMRQDLRAFQRTGVARSKANPEGVDDSLREGWEYNNLASQSLLVHMDARTYGHTFATVSANEDDPEQPLITPEDPRFFAPLIDGAKRQITAALRTYIDDSRVKRQTLYTQTSTLHLSAGDSGEWVVDDRDDHNLGLVAATMFINRPWSHRTEGRSEMADVIGKTDAIARMITNMQVAGESVAIPHRWAAGIDPDDFVDENGETLPLWESYMTVLRATENADAKFGSFATADLDNFNAAVNNMLAWCGAELGLPTRYMGQQTVNPAAEGAIIADEIRLIKNVETMNRLDGDVWAWTMELREMFRTGEMPGRNSIRALWHNPATPTYSQRADAITKLRSLGLLSRQGAWDEMGWSEERKQRELEYLAAELNDPTAQMVNQLMAGMTGASQGDY